MVTSYGKAKVTIGGAEMAPVLVETRLVEVEKPDPELAPARKSVSMRVPRHTVTCGGGFLYGEIGRKKPWETEGVSRRTWYRRRSKGEGE